MVFPLFHFPYAGNWEVRVSQLTSVVDIYIGKGTRDKSKMEYLGYIDNITNNRFIPLMKLKAQMKIKDYTNAIKHSVS